MASRKGRRRDGYYARERRKSGQAQPQGFNSSKSSRGVHYIKTKPEHSFQAFKDVFGVSRYYCIGDAKKEGK